ncbi:hypothetical protein F5883DRAFT_575298 [Diaporthe sp. PMI_573]|nr:hypothetical protein F5883DRAFT_575298 [Diaporthaceae sp. PMI_573]
MNRNPFLLNAEEQYLLSRPNCTAPGCEEFVANGYPACSVHLGPLLIKLSKSIDKRLQPGLLHVNSCLAEVGVNNRRELDAEVKPGKSAATPHALSTAAPNKTSIGAADNTQPAVNQMTSQKVPASSGKSPCIDSTETHQPSPSVLQRNFHSSPVGLPSDISKIGGLQPVSRTPPLEKQRQRLVENHDVSALDRFIYGQETASQPPLGVVVPASRQLRKRENVLYARISPRIHWTRHHSREWYQKKEEEIEARGRRKANFGKAARRMRERRLNEHPEAWEESLPERVRNDKAWLSMMRDHHRRANHGRSNKISRAGEKASRMTKKCPYRS